MAPPTEHKQLPIRHVNGGVCPVHDYLREDIKRMEGKIDDLADGLETHYVRKEEFGPVKTVVFGMVGLVMLTVLGSMLVMVVRASQ